MRTLTVKTTTEKTDMFPPGWHTLTIDKAKYGKFNDSKYIDVSFSEYAEKQIALRIYAKEGENGEEFAIGRLFRFANAGISSVSKSDDGEAIVQLDDSADQLLGKKVNVFFYKNDKGYTDVLTNIAPTEFKNDLEEFKEDDIEYWKGKAVRYYENYVKGKGKNSSSNGFVSNSSVDPEDDPDVIKVDSTADIPW